MPKCRKRGGTTFIELYKRESLVLEEAAEIIGFAARNVDDEEASDDFRELLTKLNAFRGTFDDTEIDITDQTKDETAVNEEGPPPGLES